MKLVLPDTIWSPHQLSGAAFLYFYEQKIGITLHPSVSVGLTGIDSLTFFKYLEQKSPKWKEDFNKLGGLYFSLNKNFNTNFQLLSPLKDKANLSVIQLAYDRGDHAFEKSCELLDSCSLEKEEIFETIDPLHAADELFSHIFFEKVLNVQNPDKSPDFFFELGKKVAQNQKKGIELRNDFDWAPIYEYCDELFRKFTLSELLTRAYMFRMPLLMQGDDFMLSNENLLKLLNSFPVENTGKKSSDDMEKKIDIITWEFFRQILSPYVDPLNKKTINRIIKIINKGKDEIKNFKNKCTILANDVSSEKDLEGVIKIVSNEIELKVSKDLNELLQINRKSFNNFMKDVFSNKATWVSLSGVIYSLIFGGPIITAGAAITAISIFGSKAVKNAFERKEKLQSSDYKLIYRMSH